jgi:hypothetical protein
MPRGKSKKVAPKPALTETPKPEKKVKRTAEELKQVRIANLVKARQVKAEKRAQSQNQSTDTGLPKLVEAQ